MEYTFTACPISWNHLKAAFPSTRARSNSRLIRADADSVTFRVKDYRIDGPGRYTTMTLQAHEFIRRFLMHVLPRGFHRIRHSIALSI